MEKIIEKLKEEGINYGKIKKSEYLYNEEKGALHKLIIETTNDSLKIVHCKFKRNGENGAIQNKNKNFLIQKLKGNNEYWKTFIEFIRSYRELKL